MKGVKPFLRLFYAYSFFLEFVLLYPVYMLLFEARGLSLVEITALMVIWSVPVFVLEFPSGVLADKWSRKHLILIGTTFKFTAYLLWLFADAFLMFALGFVLWGVQVAMCSGATEALLYDVLASYNEASEYEKIAGRARFYSGIGLALSMLLGGFAAALGFETVILLSMASIALSFAAALFFEEPSKAQHQSEGGWKEYISSFSQGFAACKNNKTVIAILLFSTMIIIVPGILEEYDQLYARQVLDAGGIGIAIGWVGVWGAIRTGVEALGARFAYQVKHLFGSFSRICIIALAAGAALTVASIFYSIYLAPVYILFYAILSGADVLVQGMLQREIPSDQRATVLSVQSLLMNLYAILPYFVFAAVAEPLGLRAGFVFMGVYTILTALVFLFIAGIRRKAVPAGENE